MSRTPLKYSPLTLAAGLLSLGAVTVQADQVIVDDLIVQGSLCVGQDCANGESFGFDTIRLKENNVRIKFQDTSTSGSFPSRDWQITANDSTNGGANKFSIDDIDGDRTPFTLEAGAPSNSLYVDDGGRVGLGTATPVVELHVVDGDSPTIRLEQDGSSGFTAQTWDIAGNETNFFVRDVTNGSQLPFRIQSGADNNALYVANDNDIGMGTASPTAALDIRSNNDEALNIQGNGLKLMRVTSSNGQPIQLRLSSDSVNNRRIIALQGDGTTQESQISMENDSIVLAGATMGGANRWAEIDANGLVLAGSTLIVGGTNVNVPDYVFADGYPLMPLHEVQAFIAQNSHLPNVPSAAKVKAGGLNMIEMQLALLEKVEELTLYTLQQQKIIDALEQRLKTLDLR